jgi:nitroreductase
VNHQELCVSCGHCITVCPHQAITHSNIPQNLIKTISPHKIPTDQELLDLLKTRRSIRAFQHKPIPKQLLSTIIKAAHYAPSTNNIQSTEYTVVQDTDIIKKIKNYTLTYLQKTTRRLQNPVIRTLLKSSNYDHAAHLFKRIPEYQHVINTTHNNIDLIIHNAPALLFFHANKSIGFADVNATLALQNATLIIYSLNLGCFFAGYVVAASTYEKEIPNLLKIPRENQIYGCLAIGYPQVEFSQWIERKSSNITWM